jgi:hypothetical protein
MPTNRDRTLEKKSYILLPLLSSSEFNSYDSTANQSSSIVPSNPFLRFRSKESFSTSSLVPPRISTTSIYDTNPHSYGTQHEELHSVVTEWVPTVPTQGETYAATRRSIPKESTKSRGKIIPSPKRLKPSPKRPKPIRQKTLRCHQWAGSCLPSRRLCLTTLFLRSPSRSQLPKAVGAASNIELETQQPKGGG